MNLIDILVYKRAHESKTEAKFINEWLIPKINELGYKPTMDSVGNIWVETEDKTISSLCFKKGGESAGSAQICLGNASTQKSEGTGFQRL